MNDAMPIIATGGSYKYSLHLKRNDTLPIRLIAKMLAVMVIAGALFNPRPAYAFCSEPNAPKAPWGSPPEAPWCYNAWNRTHTCESWEIESWIDEVNSYIDQMVTYAEDSREFANNAVEFANCQIEQAKEPLGG